LIVATAARICAGKGGRTLTVRSAILGALCGALLLMACDDSSPGTDAGTDAASTSDAGGATCDRADTCANLAGTGFYTDVAMCTAAFAAADPAECEDWPGLETCLCPCNGMAPAMFEVCAGMCMRTHCPFDGGM
jgi:hypothetical protein